jgi:hypothetical protein
MTYHEPSRPDVRSRPWFVIESRAGIQPGFDQTCWFCRSVDYTPSGVLLTNVRAQTGPSTVEIVQSLLLPAPGRLESFTVIYDGPEDSMDAPEPKDY